MTYLEEFKKRYLEKKEMRKAAAKLTTQTHIRLLCENALEDNEDSFFIKTEEYDYIQEVLTEMGFPPNSWSEGINYITVSLNALSDWTNGEQK